MKMYDNILKKVPLYEEKRGIEYAKVGGKLYKWINALYIIALTFTLLMNLFYVVGISLSERTFNGMKNEFYTVLALTIVLILALVLSIFKKHIWICVCSFVLNLLCCVGLTLTFAPLMEYAAGGYIFAFYCRHLVPLCLILIFSAWITVIAVRAYFKQRKNYKKILDNIYGIHHKSIEENDFTEEEWEEILKNV